MIYSESLICRTNILQILGIFKGDIERGDMLETLKYFRIHFNEKRVHLTLVNSLSETKLDKLCQSLLKF